MSNSEGTQPMRAARERELFLAALEIPDDHARAAFLEQACGGDEDLLKRVRGLFREGDRAGDFLQTPAVVMKDETRRALPGEGITEGPGDSIGSYKLMEEIGEGGCGVVYLAEQEEPVRRKVALKVIKLGMDTRSVIARFEAERQALAMMDHPNIAKVLDAGTTQKGRPYFVMELVQGIRITDYCDQAGLSTAQRLNLFTRVCLATQHAHQKGVIHRDLKPSNILVTLLDGESVPKVIDFGIAKAIPSMLSLTEKTLFTEQHAFIGTPAYMSPEQAELGGLDIDTRTDIYSLGVLLYELLTGRTPFDAEALSRSGLDECRRIIREAEPPAPSTVLSGLAEAELTDIALRRRIDAPKLVHLLRGDPDWIVMKCLEKDRTRRYATAHDLAADVFRYLEGEPVLARPPSNVYRLRKLLRRHRGAFAAAAGLMATLLVGAGVSLWQAVRATHAEQEALQAKQQESLLRQRAEWESQRAERERASARLNEYVADINLAQQALEDGNYGRSALLLNKHRPALGEHELRGFEWRFLWQVSQGDDHIMMPNQEGNVHATVFSPDGEMLALGTRDAITLWHVSTQTPIANLPHGADSLAFFPDGQTLVSGSWRTVRLWNAEDWSERRVLPGVFGPVALSRDGSRLAAMGRGGVRVLDTTDWRQVENLSRASGPFAFSSDGRRIAADTWSGIKVWSLEDSRDSVLLEDSTNVFFRIGPWARNRGAMAFSADGRHLIAGRNNVSHRGVFVLSVWDTRSGREVAVLPEDPGHVEHTGMISELAVSPDGSTLATASTDYSIRLWDLGERRMIDALHAHINEVWSVAFAPDGQSIVSTDREGGVKIWQTREQPQPKEMSLGRLQPIAFSEDGRHLAAVNRRGEFVLYDMEDQEMDSRIPLSEGRRRFLPSLCSLSRDLRTLAFSIDDGVVELLDLNTGQTRPVENADARVELIELSPDGGQLVTKRRDQTLRWWDRDTNTRGMLESEGHRARFSPDGGTLAVFGRTNAVQIWDMTTHALRTNLVVDVHPGFAEAFSPDGAILAVGYFDSAIRLWNVHDGRLLGTCIGHKQPVFSVAFSPDGKTMASSSDDRTLKFWNIDTQQELLSLRRLGGALTSLVFSPDGTMLAGGNLMSPEVGLRIYYAPPFSETDHAPGSDAVPRALPKVAGPIGDLTWESSDDF